jgi:MFS family permease
MSVTTPGPLAANQSVAVTLLPVVAVVFIGYLVIGLAMPVLPLYVHQGLGLGTFAVGLVTGAQFSASLLSRMPAGHYADSHGAKHGIVLALLIAAASGLLYLLSLYFVVSPRTSLAILLLGRAVLGVAESFIVTGAFGWGIARLGPQHTGVIMAWVGTAMYVAFAAGAPAGTALYAHDGFAAIALATTLIPLAALLLVAKLRPVAPDSQVRPSFIKVMSAVWMPGIGLAFSSVGFGAITTFIPLLYAGRGWGTAWPAYTAVSAAFVLSRLIFGHLPDRIDGVKVALIFVLIEAAGQGLIWLAPGAMLVLPGAALSGFGYALVYPGLGVEAIRRAPPESRSLVMGAYTAFLDLALGIAGPALGLIAGGVGLSSVFLVSTLAVLCSAAISLRLLSVHSAIR